MALMETSYGNDGVTTRTSGTPQFQLPDNSEMMRFAYEIARRRIAEQNAQRAAARAPIGPRMSPVDFAQASPNVWGSGPTGDDAQLEYMQKRQAIMEADQAGRGAPLRRIGGLGIAPGYTTDPNAMSAAQRRMFLPQGSAAGAVPGFSSGAEGPAIDPLSDPYSDQYRDLVSRGYSPAQIAGLKKG